MVGEESELDAGGYLSVVFRHMKLRPRNKITIFASPYLQELIGNLDTKKKYRVMSYRGNEIYIFLIFFACAKNRSIQVIQVIACYPARYGGKHVSLHSGNHVTEQG